MHLLLRRRQEDASWFQGMFGESMQFMLDARLDLTADEQEFFDRYQLAQLAIYDSDARQQHAHSANESFDDMDAALERVGDQRNEKDDRWPFLEALQHLGQGWYSAILARLSLQITLGSLVAGQHIVTESLEEILAVEDVIKKGVTYLASYIDTAVTFDGREQLDEY